MSIGTVKGLRQIEVPVIPRFRLRQIWLFMMSKTVLNTSFQILKIVSVYTVVLLVVTTCKLGQGHRCFGKT